MVPSQKLIAVVGGTGQLGSSVAISLHDNPEFQVRVLSRDPTSAKAQRLVKLGIQVVKADNWSDTDLQSAFRGCWGIFINLNSDLPNFKRKIGPSEFENGKIVVDAAVKAGVKHVVHASLPPASKLTNGKIPVYSFDDKRAISDYALAQDEFQTVTLVNAGWFLENAFDPAYETVFGGLATKVDEEGFYTWKCPSMGNDPELVPWLSVTDDYGDFVHGVFLDPQRWNKKVIHAVSESLSFAGMAASFQKGTGMPARYVEVDEPVAKDPNKAKEVKGLFTLMHAIKGNYFDGLPTNHGDAKALKGAVAHVRKLTGPEADVSTVEGFFKKHIDRVDGH